MRGQPIEAEPAHSKSGAKVILKMVMPQLAIYHSYGRDHSDHAIEAVHRHLQ